MKTLDYIKNVQQLLKTNKNVTKIYDFILENGKLFKKAKFLEIPEFKPKIKGCFFNAQRLAVENKKTEYWEGWAVPKNIPIPFEHAWNIINKEVIDTTWKDGTEYFGLKIPTKFIIIDWLKTGLSNPLLIKYCVKKLKLRRESEKKIRRLKKCKI